MLCIGVKLPFAGIIGIPLATFIEQNKVYFYDIGLCPWQYDQQNRLFMVSGRQLRLAPFYKAQR